MLGSEDDVGDVAEPHHLSVLLLHDDLLEVFDGLEVGVRDQVDRCHRSLGAAECRQIVVLRQGITSLRWRDAECGHALRLEPDAHRERAIAENLGALHAADGRELRLDNAHEVVGDLILIEIFRREAEVRGRPLTVRRLQIDDRRLGLRRKLVADLRDFRLDLRQRGVRVVVEF